MAEARDVYPPGLTETDRRIIDMLRDGKPDAEIAVRVGLPTGDVKSRIDRIIARAGVSSRADLVGRSTFALPEWAADPEPAPPPPPPAPAEADVLPEPPATTAVSRRGFLRAGAAVATVAAAAGVSGWALTRSGERDPVPASSATPPPAFTPTATPSPSGIARALGRTIRDMLQPVANVLIRREFSLDEPIPWGHGLFVMDIESRRITGWRFSGEGAVNYRIAPGGTALSWQAAGYEYLYSMHYGDGRTSYRWRLEELRLVGMTDASYLWARLDERTTRTETNGHVLTGPDFAPVAEFSVPPSPSPPQATVSPGGSAAAFWSFAPGRREQLHVLRFLTGTSGVIWEAPSGYAGGAIEAHAWGFAASVRSTDASYPPQDMITRSFEWSGRATTDPDRLPWTASPSRSPDERYSLYEEFLRDAPPDMDGQWERWPATVVANGNGEPLVRVRSAAINYGDFMPQYRWLADSSGWVALTGGGEGARFGIFSPEGDLLEELPLPPAPAEPRWFEHVLQAGALPSPFDARFVALGRLAFFDRSNAEVISIAVESADGPAHLDPWAAGPGQFVFALPHMGHGGATPPTLLAPSKELAPFAPAARLVVATSGECLDLRAEPAAEAASLACFEAGADVALSNLPGGAPGVSHAGDETWIHVSAGGLSGWVASRSLRWPEA